MLEIPYGRGYIFDFPLLTAGAPESFLAAPAPVVGDAQIRMDDAIYANLTLEMVGFTGGSERPQEGDILTGDISGETLVVIGTRLTTNSWGATTAAGTLFLHSASGAFQAEDLNNERTGTDDVMTIGGDVGNLGEFAIGTNMRIDRFIKSILFDEKIGGTIHMAVGYGFPEVGGKNESAIHWDMICDMKDGGKIFVDEELFYDSGEFKI